MPYVTTLTYGLYTPLAPTFVGGIRTWIDTFWPRFLGSTKSELRLIHCDFTPAGGATKAFVPPHPAISVKRVAGRNIPGLPAPIPGANALSEALQGVDVLYVDNGYAFQDVVAVAAARRVGATVVSGHHSVIRHGFGHSMYWGTFGRSTVKKFDGVHALNESDAEYLSKIGARNVHVVPISIDDRRFVSGRRGKAPVLAFVGRLHRQKGIDRLVRVIPFILAAIPEITIEICGDGPERDLLRTIEHEDRVTYHGAVGPERVADVLSRSDVLLMPSRSETFGIVAAEALMSGCSVIGSDLPALREVLGVRGTVVSRADSVSEWVSAVKVDIAKRQFDENRAYARSRFAWENVAPKFAHLIAVARTAAS